MAKTYSLKELVDAANNQLVSEGLDASWNDRLVRYYTSEKKILTPPDKDGREARYNEDHLEKLVTLRRAQKMGITASALDSAIKYSANAPGLAQGMTNTSKAAAYSMSSPGDASGNRGHLFAGSITASASAATPNATQETALSYLRSLDAKTREDALLGNVTQMVQQPVSVIQAASTPQPEHYINWELLPGIRLQIRTDCYEKFSAEEERVVIDAVKNIRKNKP